MQAVGGTRPVGLGGVAQLGQIGSGHGLVDLHGFAAVQDAVAIGIQPQGAVGRQADNAHGLQCFARTDGGVVGGPGVAVGQHKVCCAEAVAAVFGDGFAVAADRANVVVVGQVQREGVALGGVGLARAVVGGDLDAQAGKVGGRVATECAVGPIEAQPAGQGTAIALCGGVGEAVIAWVGIGESGSVKGVAEAARAIPGLVRDGGGHNRLVVVVGECDVEVARADELAVVGGQADSDGRGVGGGVTRKTQVVGIKSQPTGQGAAIGQCGGHGHGVAIGVDQGLVAA